jgi:hypothetical protein
MTDVPSNLIPTRITQLPDAPVASPDGLLLFVYQGNSYKVRAGDLLSVAGVPTSRQVIAGTALTGGGALSSDVTLSVANNGIGTTQLADSGVTSGTYGDSTNIPVFTVDATGRVTSATTIALSVTGYVPLATQVIAGTGLTGGGTLNNDVTLAVNLSSSLPIVGNVSGVAGVATTISRSDHQHPSVNLADNDQVNGLVGLQHGGTAKSLVADAGAIIWSGADGLYVGPAGLAGQVLVSGGTSAPTWGSALLVVDQPANVVYAGPVSGASAPTAFRALVNADFPVSGVTANTYGSATLIPVVTVNSKGVITSVTTVSVSAGVGTVTSASVVSANGFTGTVATATTTPAITLATSVTGVLKGNGTALSAATSGTDYSLGTSALATGIVKSTTTTGDLTIAVAADFPTLNQDTTGTSAATNGLKTATTTVVINSATAPSNGQVLTATGSTAATWQTPTVGTVTSVSVVSANGFTGTSSGGATPALTLTTSITGVLKGNGTALSVATSGTDYSLGTSALATGIVKSTTTTGDLTIAIAADFPTLNQNTSGTAAGLSATLVIGSGGTGTVHGVDGGTF